MFLPFLKPLLLVECSLVPLWLLYRLIALKFAGFNASNIQYSKEFGRLAFAMYVAGLLAITVAPVFMAGVNELGSERLNLLPVINNYNYFISTFQEPSGSSTAFALNNLVGNVLMFIPMGIFIPFLYPASRRLTKVILICIVCSASIEITQYFLRDFGTFRAADIDDVILNTLGGITGWGVYTKLPGGYFTKPLEVAK